LEKAIYAIMIAFIVGVILCPIFIPFLHRLKYGQYIRDDGPQSHLKKQGTPSMGGIVIIGAFVVGSLFFLKGNMDGLVVILVTIGFGIIGFVDDYIKVVKKRSMGLRPLQKIIGQLLITSFFVWYLLKSGTGTSIFIPFTSGENLFDLGYLFIPFVFVTILGTVNGVNLTDGLDGLASGVTLLIAIFFLLVAWAVGSHVTPICGAVIGSLLAFLVFNAYPARVFMGDTGSLALGGFVASVAFLLKMPLMILIVGFIYLLESVSVIIQVVYFKKTGGKRFFKMAPIHHHFEQCGWSETKVVTIFYIATAMLCLIGFLACRAMFL